MATLQVKGMEGKEHTCKRQEGQGEDCVAGQEYSIEMGF